MPAVLLLPCPACATSNRVPEERVRDVPVCGRCGERLFGERPAELDDERFARYVEASDLPVLVDFWADWCGPCHKMAPHFESAAREHAGRVLFAKLDTERALETTRRFAIESIPTVILFRGGREIARRTGAMESAEISRWLAGSGAYSAV